jgi:hypothetical protein
MCCSGCFSAYRRDAVAPVLDDWLDQTFLGQPSTFGDDRSLTNFVLHRWRVLYAPDAQAYTNVPEHLKQFLRQQLRWKKSWLREIPRAARAVAHKNPIMATMFGLSVILPLLAPQVVLRAMVVQPHFIYELPFWYFGGVAAIALIYGMFYRMNKPAKRWYQGIFFTLFYTIILWCRRCRMRWPPSATRNGEHDESSDRRKGMRLPGVRASTTFSRRRHGHRGNHTVDSSSRRISDRAGNVAVAARQVTRQRERDSRRSFRSTPEPGPVDPALVARLANTSTSPQGAPIIITYHDIGYNRLPATP